MFPRSLWPLAFTFGAFLRLLAIVLSPVFSAIHYGNFQPLRRLIGFLLLAASWTASVSILGTASVLRRIAPGFFFQHPHASAVSVCLIGTCLAASIASDKSRDRIGKFLAGFFAPGRSLLAHRTQLVRFFSSFPDFVGAVARPASGPWTRCTYAAFSATSFIVLAAWLEQLFAARPQALALSVPHALFHLGTLARAPFGDVPVLAASRQLSMPLLVPLSVGAISLILVFLARGFLIPGPFWRFSQAVPSHQVATAVQPHGQDSGSGANVVPEKALWGPTRVQLD